MSGLLPSPVWPPTAPPADGRLGSVSLTPTGPVVAGEFGTWTLTYTAGRFGIDDVGALRIALHQTSDLGAPQLTDPAAPDYCTVAWSTPGPCRIEARYDGELGVRPWKRILSLRVRDRAVRPGDTVRVTFGDRSGGSPGARGQTYAGPLRLQVLVDAYGTGIFLPVAGPSEVPVVAGAPDRLRLHVPSDVTAGRAFEVTAVTIDRWGNVTGHRREAATLDSPGVTTLRRTDAASGLVGESNPVRVHPPEAPPRRRTVWGDLHAQSEETVGSGTLDEYFSHARDCAAVDFVGHQGNDFQVTEPVWRAIMAKTQAYDAENRFLTFAGYEWSGNTPGGGDHNVHFKGGPGQDYTLHRSGHWQIADRSDEATDRFPVSDLYQAFRGRDDVILIPHVGGRYANLLEFFDESLMPLVEIASCWGVFEWLAGDAFAGGHVFGVSAGSDDHTGRPGMSHSPRGHFATGGGLTAVLAADGSREAVWEAIRARRTYATTGARLLLDVSLRLSDGDGDGPAGGSPAHPMGTHLPRERSGSGEVTLGVAVQGTAPLWRAEVLRWPEVLAGAPLPAPAPPAGTYALRIGWTGSRIRARRRLTDWAGALRVVAGRARITGASGWGFDQPEDGIYEQGGEHVAWRSVTAGDWDGITVQVEGEGEATLEFATGPATFRFTLAAADEQPIEVDAGGVGQRVVVERDPGPGQPRAAAMEVRDRPPAGRSYYLVRVTQQDGHIAWSSPIVVDR